MKIMAKTCLVLIATLVFSAAANSQSIPAPEAKLIEELECSLQRLMPDWTRQRGEPFSKTERVIIDFWSNCGRRVKVAINYRPSDAGAVKWRPGGRVIPGLGDEAYAFGYSDDIGMRKGNLLISISTSSIPSFPGVDEGERSAISRAEEIALNKGFARLISTLLSHPRLKCGEMFEIF